MTLSVSMVNSSLEARAAQTTKVLQYSILVIIGLGIIYDANNINLFLLKIKQLIYSYYNCNFSFKLEN